VTKIDRQKLTLYRPVTYQIRVSGEIGESWSDWAGGMTIKVETEVDGTSLTTLTGSLDQAALQGLLRQLYFLGLPLISAICVEAGLDMTTTERENGNRGTNQGAEND
jgi:hypothetical protein